MKFDFTFTDFDFIVNKHCNFPGIENYKNLSIEEKEEIFERDFKKSVAYQQLESIANIILVIPKFMWQGYHNHEKT